MMPAVPPSSPTPPSIHGLLIFLHNFFSFSRLIIIRCPYGSVPFRFLFFLLFLSDVFSISLIPFSDRVPGTELLRASAQTDYESFVSLFVLP